MKKVQQIKGKIRRMGVFFVGLKGWVFTRGSDRYGC